MSDLKRASWDEYYSSLASTVATRATCSRRQVGAIIVSGKRIVSTGYNGGPPKTLHCIDGGCPRAQSDTPAGSDYDECIAIHAEANAIMFSSPEERDGATMYCTQHPCFGCAKLISNSGIGEVVVLGVYEGYERARLFMMYTGVRVRLLGGHDGSV